MKSYPTAPAQVTSQVPIEARAEPLEARRLTSATATAAIAAGVPGPLHRPDHVVIVVEENQSYSDILGPLTLPPAAGPWALPNPLLHDPFIRNPAVPRPADGLVRGAQSEGRHALRHGPRGGPLAPRTPGPLRPLGAEPQQHARGYLGRG